MLIRTFVLKVINNDRKKLTHHEITDHITEENCIGAHSSVQGIEIVNSWEHKR